MTSLGNTPVPRGRPAQADVLAQISAALRVGYGLRLNAAPRRLPSAPDVERYACDTNAGLFVLRRFAPLHSPDAVQRSLEIVESLVSSGFPAAAPLATRDNQLLVLIDGQFAALFYAVDGLPPTATGPELRAAGRTIGHLHLLCSYEDDSTLEDLPLRSALEARLASILRGGNLTPAAVELAQAIGERLEYLELTHDLPVGIVHGSLTAEQLVLADDGAFYIQDSDVFARGPLLLDLSVLACECCFQTPEQPQLKPMLLAELVEGYSLGLRRKVWMEEWQALPMLIYYGALLLSVSQLTTQAAVLASADDLLAWRTVLALEAGWEQLSALVVELGMDQVAPSRHG